MSRVWILFCLPIVTGITFYGSCPNLVPTHNLRNLTLNIDAEVILGVPFSSDNPTHLFKNITTSDSSGYFFNLQTRIDGKKEILKLTMGYSMGQPKLTSQHRGVIDPLAESITTESSIFSPIDPDSRIPCHKVIKEDIKIWMDGEFIIVWSCINQPKMYDEAVLILAYPQRKFRFDYNTDGQDPFKKMIQDLKSITGKYLKKKFKELIKWPETPGNIKDNYDPYKCPLKSYVKSIVFASSIFVVWVCYGIVIWLY